MAGYAAALWIEKRQVGEQVLMRASAVLFLLVVFWDAPGKGRCVREDLQEFLLTAQRAFVTRRNAGQPPASLLAELAGVAVFDVVAEQVRPEQMVDVGLAMDVTRLRQASEFGSLPVGSARAGLLVGCPQRDQRRPGLHLRVH